MRPETGRMRFDDDWAGVFIRGDNAMYYAIYLDNILRNIHPQNPDTLYAIPLQELVRVLRNVNQETPDTQEMKNYTECLKAKS